MNNVNYIGSLSKKHKILKQKIKRARLSMMMDYQAISLKKEKLRIKDKLFS